MKYPLILLALLLLPFTTHADSATGVPIVYRLPPTPDRTYLITLAIVDLKNPDWIVSTFLNGQPRAVTAENQGKFTETWDGLDDNYMPVPPGEYGVKGIYSAAKKWDIDGEYHAITPQFAGGASSWMPPAENRRAGIPFGGDPVNAPLLDVAVGPDGIGVFYYQYLENGTNLPMFDLNKPVGYDQFIRAFNSGGAGGGSCVATDGATVWAFSTDGGPKYVYRADGKSFGQSPGANRRNSYLPEGWVTAMAAQKIEGGKSLVYVAQRGKILAEKGARHTSYRESDSEFIDKITIHDGEDGKIISQCAIFHPAAIALKADALYVLSPDPEGFAVLIVSLKKGLPDGPPRRLFTVPQTIHPADLEIDHHDRFYLSDTKANKVYQLDQAGKITRTFGNLAEQKPGTYDPNTLMAPGKLATWTDKQGADRLMIVELAGPNRVSEWNTADGTLIRDFMSHQTKCNNGYAIDPDDASLIYLPGQGNWLTRFKVDYQTGVWKVDAVWPDVEAGQHQGLDKPVVIRAKGNTYLASERTLAIYKLAGDRWVRSAGLITKDKQSFFWNDANNNREMDDAELRPVDLPRGATTYHGQKWIADFSYIAVAQGSKDVLRLAPDSFDAHGNPVFSKFTVLLTDPIFTARAKGTATALFGGNEIASNFTSDWAQADGSLADGFYVQARGGNGFNANHGAQHKISRYIPDGKGGYTLLWRVGRSTFSRPDRGEMLGGMRIFSPINGLLTAVDQTRSGLLLYTTDGLYVDTLFRSGEEKSAGLYALPGEFFAGTVYADKTSGKIYYASGKYTPLLHSMEGWSLKENSVQRLTDLQARVTINASQIASPPEMALSLRGGAGKAPVARFYPALGGAAIDGSMTGFESAEPVEYSQAKDQSVEVRALYDPEHLYLRYHVRLPAAFAPKPLPPLERIFTHDQASDTVSFYIQGDANAPAKAVAVGRPGDVRFVFGLFKDGDHVKPAAVGLYPNWTGPGASPQVYRTPVGSASFAHVGAIPGIELGHAIDPDKKGFVITVSIPRAAIPAMSAPFSGSLRTLVNFDANLGGHSKFFWANTDGSASRETYDEPSEARLYPGAFAPALFQAIDKGVTLRQWITVGPFGGPGAEKFMSDQRDGKEQVVKFYNAANFPPDTHPLDFKATYQGDMIKGFWPDPKKIAWKPAQVAPLDTRVALGGGSQVWYGATWIYSPTDIELDLSLRSSPMVYVRWFLNDAELNVAKYDKDVEGKQTLSATKKVKLKAGWNQLSHRAFCTGYPPLKVGAVVIAPETTLWNLKFSGDPK